MFIVYLLKLLKKELGLLRNILESMFRFMILMYRIQGGRKLKNTVNIDEVISKATKAAIKEYDKEKLGERKKRAFHNTKLLLSNYNDLNNHVNKAIDEVGGLETDLIELDDLDREDIYILSIKRSKTKTLIMIAHIDMMLATLEERQRKLCAVEKYQALKMLYIDEIPYDEIVKYFRCGVNTPRRWINEMIDKLSLLLFGYESLKIDLG